MKFFCRNGTQIVVRPTGTLVITPAGAMVCGEPQEGDEQAETAKRLGYGDDTMAMVRDHDPLHALLCDWMGLPSGSYSLRSAAGERLTVKEMEIAALEEEAVLAVQSFMRHAGLPLPGTR